MKKIPCLFMIDHEAHETTNQINPKAAFILSADNVRATIKRDGQAMRLTEDGQWLTRRAVNAGKKAPANFVLEQFDENTGKSFGWEPVEQSSVMKAFKDAIAHSDDNFAPGTFELCGPKVNGNHENLPHHQLFIHGSEEMIFPDIRDVEHDEIKDMLTPMFAQMQRDGLEGVVLWLDGAPAVKIRVKDFPALGGAAR